MVLHYRRFLEICAVAWSTFTSTRDDATSCTVNKQQAPAAPAASQVTLITHLIGLIRVRFAMRANQGTVKSIQF